MIAERYLKRGMIDSTKGVYSFVVEGYSGFTTVAQKSVSSI
jgi:hypothetical protein